LWRSVFGLNKGKMEGWKKKGEIKGYGRAAQEQYQVHENARGDEICTQLFESLILEKIISSLI